MRINYTKAVPELCWFRIYIHMWGKP